MSKKLNSFFKNTPQISEYLVKNSSIIQIRLYRDSSNLIKQLSSLALKENVNLPLSKIKRLVKKLVKDMLIKLKQKTVMSNKAISSLQESTINGFSTEEMLEKLAPGIKSFAKGLNNLLTQLATSFSIDKEYPAESDFYSAAILIQILTSSLVSVIVYPLLSKLKQLHKQFYEEYVNSYKNWIIFLKTYKTEDKRILRLSKLTESKSLKVYFSKQFGMFLMSFVKLWVITSFSLFIAIFVPSFVSTLNAILLSKRVVSARQEQERLSKLEMMNILLSGADIRYLIHLLNDFSSFKTWVERLPFVLSKKQQHPVFVGSLLTSLKTVPNFRKNLSYYYSAFKGIITILTSKAKSYLIVKLDLDKYINTIFVVNWILTTIHDFLQYAESGQNMIMKIVVKTFVKFEASE